MAFLDQPGNHPAFAGAEIEFAMRFEDFADRPVGGAFDFLVDIDEVGVEQRREAASDRGLADPHQADQHHGAIDPPGKAADFGRREGCCMGHCRRA